LLIVAVQVTVVVRQRSLKAESTGELLHLHRVQLLRGSTDGGDTAVVLESR
jgi:hypothetical protein